MGPDGTTALVDVVLDQPGQVRVEKTQFGFAASIESGKVAQTKAAVAPGKQAAATTPPMPAVPAVAAPAAKSAPERVPEPVAASEPPNEIKEIVYTKLPGERVQVVVRMARRPSEPSTFSITNPARVALDFPATRVAMANKSIAVREGAVSSVAAIESEGR